MTHQTLFIMKNQNLKIKKFLKLPLLLLCTILLMSFSNLSEIDETNSLLLNDSKVLDNSEDDYQTITITINFKGEDQTLTFEGDPEKLQQTIFVEGKGINTSEDVTTWKPFYMVWGNGDPFYTFTGEIGWDEGTSWNDVCDFLIALATS